MSLLDEESLGSGDQDNRYFPRWEVVSPVRYQLEDDPGVQEGLTKDLSCSGACLRISGHIRPRQKIKLTIFLSDRDQVELDGHIVWLKGSGENHEIGIDFCDVSTAAQGLILKHAFEIDKNNVITQWFKGWTGQEPPPQN